MFGLHGIQAKARESREALEGPESAKAIDAFHTERDSLLDTVLVPIPDNDPDYQRCYELAIPGRYLLDVRRSEDWKARGVKQGFKENKHNADGPDFQYYSNVAQCWRLPGLPSNTRGLLVLVFPIVVIV